MLKAVLIQLVLLIVLYGGGTVSQLLTDPNEVGFYLFPNRDNFSDYDVLEYQNLPSITASRFSSSKNVIFLIHGFTSNFTSDFPTVLIKAYLNAGYGTKSNIIAVDWGKFAGASTLYVGAVLNVPILGRRIKDFILFLENNEKISGPDQVHMIGQSLGAHAAGFAGMYYKQNTSYLLDRITGTDPAGPLYQDIPIDQRLDSTDASFVDVVHTNQGGLGYVGRLGQVDFYKKKKKVDFFVNGFPKIIIQLQPACTTPANILNIPCSHRSAPHYYAQSITNNGLLARRVGVPGSETAIFGEFCPRTTPAGSYTISLTLSPSEIPPP